MVAMRMEGSRTVRVDRRAVWEALTDIDCLKVCIAGCVSVTRLSNTRYGVVVGVSLGPVRVPFRGSVEIKSCDPPRVYHITARGEGGLAGIAAGAATIRLSEVPDGCRLGYVIDAECNGRLAALGALFLTGKARTLTERFLARFTARLERAGEQPGFRAEERRSWL